MNGRLLVSAIVVSASVACSSQASAGIIFTTGDPDGLMATASRPAAGGKTEIESADDFILSSSTTIASATFTGLLTGGATLADIDAVDIEIYRIFPKDSDTVRTPQVPSRANSPSDVEFDSRDSGANTLTFFTTILSPSFSAANSVLNGINKSPNQTTGGEGAIRGMEVLFTVNFLTPFVLPADHYFFIPQVQTTTGTEFFWLSAAKTIPAPADLQEWIRNANLDPDWLRVGTDIVGGNPAPNFNASFSLSDTT
ncbi:MAG TPA: PEP-CTERM sorting domain-containing protein, partial [Burkholderiales bacterium]|nr:PEP-CTERM sorting domain-containing protein [Burkholderiales bacterium]